MELTGVLKWVFIICVLGGSVAIMIIGALYAVSFVWEKCGDKIFHVWGGTAKLFEYVWHRKEFKKWLKQKGGGECQC